MKWEYLVGIAPETNQINLIQDWLDKLGRQGWELVATKNDRAYIFKRPLK